MTNDEGAAGRPFVIGHLAFVIVWWGIAGALVI
jgi:hypothetical protein